MGRNCHGPKWLWAEMTSYHSFILFPFSLKHKTLNIFYLLSYLSILKTDKKFRYPNQKRCYHFLSFRQTHSGSYVTMFHIVAVENGMPATQLPGSNTSSLTIGGSNDSCYLVCLLKLLVMYSLPLFFAFQAFMSLFKH